MTTHGLHIACVSPGVRPETSVDGHLRLRAEVDWLVSGPAEHLQEIKEALPSVALGDASQEALLLSFGNSVGRVTVPYLGQVELVCGKWDEQHFEALLRDLTEISAGLPFAAGTPTALPYERDVLTNTDVLYHAFVYLRHILSDESAPERSLLPALRAVVEHPHRRFVREEISVPLDQARSIRPSAMIRMVTGQEVLHRVPISSVTDSPAALALRGHLPERVRETRVRNTEDTAENRFVKMFLETSMDVIERVRAASSGPSAFHGTVRSDCDRMEQALLPVIRHGLWRNVGRLAHFPTGSTVLQRRHGYRQVLEHHTRMRLATRLPLSPDAAQDLLEVKDIARLYELWCFFAVARKVEGILGAPTSAGEPRSDEWQVSAGRGLEIRWSERARLLYNVSFSRRATAGRRSYSVPLRPDIVLEVAKADGPVLHLLDAKFRVDSLNAITDECAEAEERRGDYKRADLYKMHAYRDAIPQARSVWILYPGTEAIFFDVTAEVVRDMGSLTDAAEGVGALPFVPIGTNASDWYTEMPRSFESVLWRILGS